jgi:hypothetical protein
MHELGMVLMVMAASAAGCKKQVKMDEVEAFLKGRLTEIGIPPSKVTCPRDVGTEVGIRFECNTVIEGTSYAIVVTITKADGDKLLFDNEWKRGEALFRNLLQPKLADFNSKTLGVPIEVQCAEPLLFLDAKRTVSCDATDGTTPFKIIVTVDDKLEPTGQTTEPLVANRASIEDLLRPSIAEQLPNATLSCGTGALIAFGPARRTSGCKLVENGKDLGVSVGIDAQHHPFWEVVP